MTAFGALIARDLRLAVRASGGAAPLGAVLTLGKGA
jgi:hypothetical protein